MGDRKLIYFHGFGICGRVPDSQHDLFLSLETPRTPQINQENPKSIFGNIICIYPMRLDIGNFVFVFFVWGSPFWKSTLLKIVEKMGTEKNLVDLE